MSTETTGELERPPGENEGGTEPDEGALAVMAAVERLAEELPILASVVRDEVDKVWPHTDSLSYVARGWVEAVQRHQDAQAAQAATGQVDALSRPPGQ